MKRLTNILPILLIILLAFLLTWHLMRPGFFSMQDDLHLFRLSEFDLCLKSGQIPCRYSPNSALGFGSPVFNFYPPFTYAFAEIFHLLEFSLINSLKIIYILPLFFGPIYLYLFTKKYFGANGGLISAFLFALAPYQAINLYVRGALAEHFALNLIPVIFYFFYKKKTKTTIVFLCFLFLSHQLTTLYCLPLLFLFSLFHQKIKYYFLIVLWSLLLCSFFLLPSVLEKNLTTNVTMTQGYFNFINHFATLRQLFLDRFWGYGASLWGPKDDMSFQIGLIQWLLPLLALFFAFRKNQKNKYTILAVLFIGLFFLFLTHNKSTFIWHLFPIMAYFQFPWRFLGPALLCLCFVSASLRPNKLFLTLLIFSSIYLNYSFFREDIWFNNLSDTQKLTGGNLVAQQGAGLKDFYPKFSLEFPKYPSANLPIIIAGQASPSIIQKTSTVFSGEININTPQATVNLPVAYFPKMELRLDGQKSTYRIDPILGLVQFDLPSGLHHYYIRFSDTPIRLFANLISVLALLAFIIKIIRDQK